ncbi:MAG: DUF1674 domain-containing protein [Gammaproteobacteria bacterium]
MSAKSFEPASDKVPDRIEDVEDAPKIVPDNKQEIGGPRGPEPTRYGDWEKKGRCIDF